MTPRVYQAEDGTVFVEDRPLRSEGIFKIVHLGPVSVECGWWMGELITERVLKDIQVMEIRELKAERPWS